MHWLLSHYSHLTDDEIQAQNVSCYSLHVKAEEWKLHPSQLGHNALGLLGPNESFPESDALQTHIKYFRSGEKMKRRYYLPQLFSNIWSGNVKSDSPRPWKGQRLWTPQLHNQCRTPGYLCSCFLCLAIRSESRLTTLPLVWSLKFKE